MSIVKLFTVSSAWACSFYMMWSPNPIKQSTAHKWNSPHAFFITYPFYSRSTHSLADKVIQTELYLILCQIKSMWITYRFGGKWALIESYDPENTLWRPLEGISYWDLIHVIMFHKSVHLHLSISSESIKALANTTLVEAQGRRAAKRTIISCLLTLHWTSLCVKFLFAFCIGI